LADIEDIILTGTKQHRSHGRIFGSGKAPHRCSDRSNTKDVYASIM
jgi:hypothetical protein